MPEVAEIPVDNSAPALDPQGDAAATPTPPGLNYAALDALLPDTDDVPEYLRGKPLKEAARLADQWRGEAATANRENREANRERLRLAEAMLELRSQPPLQAPRAPQRVYVPDGQGNAVEQPLDALIAQHLRPIQEKLQDAENSSFFLASESARERARAAANVPSDVWEEASPDLGAILRANALDTRDPKNWTQAWNLALKRASRMVGQRAPTPQMPAPPVGSAMSTAAARQAPRLTEAQRRNIDDVATLAGIKKDSPTYKKLISRAAKDAEAGGYIHDIDD